MQAVVAPGSDLARRTLAEVDFRRRYGAIVVGLWRQDGWLDDELSRTRLRAGDVLVLQGDDEALARVSSAPGILMIVPFHGEGRVRRKAPLAAGIMLLTVLAAPFDVMALEIAGLAGAVAMVLPAVSRRPGLPCDRQPDLRVHRGRDSFGAAMKSSGAAGTVAGVAAGADAGLESAADPLVSSPSCPWSAVHVRCRDHRALRDRSPSRRSRRRSTAHGAVVVTVAMASVVAFSHADRPITATC